MLKLTPIDCDISMRNIPYDKRTVYENCVVYVNHLPSDTHEKGYREYTLFYNGKVKVSDYDGVHVLPYNEIEYQNTNRP